MHGRYFRLVALAALIVLALSACGSGRKSRPQAELDALRQEVLDATKEADFYFDQAYYSAAKAGYEKIAPKAEEYTSYGGTSADVSEALNRAKSRLESKEIAEGIQGKVCIGGVWVDPRQYALKKSKQLADLAAPDLQADIDEAKAALLKLKPLEEKLLKQKAAKNILAKGQDATPFVALWMEEDDLETNLLALGLLMAMDDREDIIFATALGSVRSKNDDIAEHGARLLGHFPRKESAVELVVALEKKNEALIDAAVAGLCSTNTELGKRYILEKAKTARKLSPLREAIIKHIHGLNNHEAMEILTAAAIEGFSDATMAQIKKYAIDSLLKTSNPETLPALKTVLGKAGLDDREEVLEILKRVRDASYTQAAPEVASAFVIFSVDRQDVKKPEGVLNLAVDTIGKIADQSCVDSVVAMVLALDINGGDKAQQAATDAMLGRLTNTLKRVKRSDTVQRFIDRLTPYESRETIISATLALGAFGEEAERAVDILWRNVYLRFKSDDQVKTAVISALARIGSQAAMTYLVNVLKSADVTAAVSQYITTEVPKLIGRESAFESIFANLEGCKTETLAAFFKTIADCKNETAITPLMTAATKGEENVRLEAIRTLATFQNRIKEQDRTDALMAILKKNLVAKQTELNIGKTKSLCEVLVPYGDSVLPLLLDAVKAANWGVRYYSADAIYEIWKQNPAALGKYTGEISDISRKLAENNDPYTALPLARACSLPTRELENKIKSLQQAVNTAHPAGIALRASFKDMTDKLGTDYQEFASKLDKKVRYCYYPSLKIVIGLGKVEQDSEEQIWAIAYLKGFNGTVFGATIGENIDAALMMIGPMSYEESRGGYWIYNDARQCILAFVSERNQAVRFVIEHFTPDVRFADEIRAIIEGTIKTP
jgi:hypothetical protein